MKSQYLFITILGVLLIFSSCKKEKEITEPSISTTGITEISTTSARSGGNISDDGGGKVTARGVCWCTIKWDYSSVPTLEDNHTTDGNGKGSFASNITGLTANTTYYVRAYATNSKGTAYGEQRTFITTSTTSGLATVTTNAVSNITSNTATCGGNVTADGGSTVTVKGVCWNTIPNPTKENSRTIDGYGLGAFASSITGLNSGTTYYVRSYVTNFSGTSYGNQVSFTTPIPPTWVQKANFGGSVRSGAIGMAIGDKGYIGLGYDGSTGNSDFWEYNPSLNQWTQKANFGGGIRVGAFCFSMNNKGYVGSGSANSVMKNDLWEYNPSSNSWTAKATAPSRYKATGFSVSDKGYVCGGQSLDGDYYSDLYEYNPSSNSWTKKANFPSGFRRDAIGFSIGSVGYFGTGSNTGQSNNDFWEYNPSSNSWTQKANFGGGTRYSATGIAIGNKGYVCFGGNVTIGTNTDIWEYNPSYNSWTQKTNFIGSPRTDAKGFAIGNKGYFGVGLGLSGSTTIRFNDFWEFTP